MHVGRRDLAVAEQVGDESRWFHYGLTSSDVVDTGLALQLRAAGVEVLAGLEALRAKRVAKYLAEMLPHADDPDIAEPPASETQLRKPPRRPAAARS